MEGTDQRPSTLVDTEAGERYEYVVREAMMIFHDSALLDPNLPITEDDIHKIAKFHQRISPTNPQNPWRLMKSDRSIEKGELADPSFFSNWESPGGPLEHINLATEASRLIVSILQTHLKPYTDPNRWKETVQKQIIELKPLHAAAAAALHDEGRMITHEFYTNEVIGTRLLKRIGIREDLISVMPSENVMLVSPQEDMNQHILNLPAETVIIRIADEFGKRAPGTNRLYQPEDYDSWDRDKWAKGYMNRPPSGRKTDQKMRSNISVHVANVPRYFKALDLWVREVSTLSLKDLTLELNKNLAHRLTEV